MESRTAKGGSWNKKRYSNKPRWRICKTSRDLNQHGIQMEDRIDSSKPKKIGKIIPECSQQLSQSVRRFLEPFGSIWAALAAFWLPVEPQLGSKRLQKSERGPQNVPKGCPKEQSGAKRHRKEAKSAVTAAKREPKGTKRELRGSQKGAKEGY